MLELYLNTTTRTFYDADGDPFRDNNPQGAFQSRETIKIYLCTETPEAGEEAANPQSWTRDTYFGTIEGISAKLTCDNDYIHKLKGSLTGELPSGSVSSITATISGATLGKIPEFGTVRLYSSNGNYESVAYSERSLSGETVTFTVSGTITNSYSTGATVDCDQSPYCEAYVDAEQSDIANGELVFDLAYDSVRLREEMQYTDTEKLQVKGLELLFYKTNSDATQEKIKRFLCETFIITGTLGNIGYESEPPEPVVNMIESAVASSVNTIKPKIDSESGNWFIGNSDTGVKAEGKDGTNGKSAYELWLEEDGNEGKSLDDFFNAYRGADGTGLTVRGAYDSTSTYQKTETAMDAVQYNGSLWGYINETAGSGNAPPETSETTSNDYWTLLVGKGDKGKNGRGIVSIEKTSTQDNVDTYTITYTDETTSTFTVTNPEEVTWENLSGKPSAFPPSSHTQAISTINGLQAELDSRVKSVNGVTPDSSGNVNVSGGSGGGSTIKPAYVTAEPSGNTVTVQAITPSADGSTSTNDGQPVTVLWNFELPEASASSQSEEE